ncbi:hypothetical protein CRUP_018834, partial [Coryphaenoides rupestris]
MGWVMEVMELVPGGEGITVDRSNSELYSAFSSGFLKVCGGNILSLFQPTELMAMVVGNDNYNWEEMEKKKQFLLFLTGSDRIPIHGMESLRIALQSTGAREHYLPVAHTCYNLLDLPQYPSKDTLRLRLTQAIEQYEGFSL